MSEKKKAVSNESSEEQAVNENNANEVTEGSPLEEETQKMLEEARAAKAEALELLQQAKEALAAAKAQQEITTATSSAPTTDADTEAQKEQAYLEEKVQIRLFKDSDKYKGDVLVCVNGERLLIKRGETVEIPRKFALVLEQSAQQDADTASLIESKSAEFEAEAKAHNV